jgi:signal transduction histidine kinase
MKGLRERLLEKSASNLLSAAEPTLIRDYYQSVLDSVGAVVYTVNRDLHITGVNQQWDNFALENDASHLTSEHILGRPLLDQMHGAPLERWRVICPQILSGECPRYLDEIASQEPYAWRHYSLSAYPLRNSQGEILGITFVTSNITQLKKAEHEMFQRIVQIRGLSQVAHTAGSWVDRRKVFKGVTADIAHLFNADKCVIFLWDEHSGHLQAQEPAYGLAGRKLADLALDMGHPADPDSLWTDLEERDYILLNEGDEAPPDMVETSARVDRLAAMMGILRVSGRIHGGILVAGCARHFSQQDGQLLALFAVPLALSIENTELNRRLLDRTQQLATTRDELEHTVRVVEAIRKPLTVVRGYFELLNDGVLGPVAEEKKPTMGLISDKIRAIASLVSRISPTRFPHDATRYEQLYLADLIHAVLKEHQPTLQQAGVTLVTELPASHAPHTLTTGDPDLLFNIFETLLRHITRRAVKGGTLQVSLDCSKDILYAKLALPDVEIPLQELVSIWKPDTGDADLSQVKRVVEGHGGQIWAESAPDQGSAFYVALRQIERPPAPL